MMNYLVTGAGNGIGYQVVLALADNPDNRIIALSRNVKNLEKLTTEAKNSAKKGEVLPFPIDLTMFSSNDIIEFLNLQQVNSLDGLVNNAGLLKNKPFEELNQEDFKLIYAVNLFAPAELTRILIPYLKKSFKPHVVNISSLGGFQGSSKFKGLSAYSSSKAALACLTECLAVEFADDKISFNALALGAVETEMLQQAFPGYKAPVSASDAGQFIADFLIKGHSLFNGKTLPVSLSAQ